MAICIQAFNEKFLSAIGVTIGATAATPGANESWNWDADGTKIIIKTGAGQVITADKAGNVSLTTGPPVDGMRWKRIKHPSKANCYAFKSDFDTYLGINETGMATCKAKFDDSGVFMLTKLSEVASAIEADAKARAEAEAKAKAAADAAAAEAVAKAKLEAELKAKADAELKAKIEAELKARAEAEAKALEIERQAKLLEKQAKAEAEARTKAAAEADAKARADAEAKAKAAAEEAFRLKIEAEVRAKIEAEVRAKHEAEEKAKAEARAAAEAEEARRKMEAMAVAPPASDPGFGYPPGGMPPGMGFPPGGMPPGMGFPPGGMPPGMGMPPGHHHGHGRGRGGFGMAFGFRLADPFGDHPPAPAEDLPWGAAPVPGGPGFTGGVMFGGPATAPVPGGPGFTGGVMFGGPAVAPAGHPRDWPPFNVRVVGNTVYSNPGFPFARPAGA